MLTYDLETAQDTFLADYRLSQASIKHHFWWIWKFIFKHNAYISEQVQTLSENFQVLFLEDDHLMSTDVIFLLKSLTSFKRKHCENCFSINIGFHDATKKNLDITKTWKFFQNGISSNIGLSFSKSSFQILEKQQGEFCSYDEYNWDLTMNHLAQKGFIPETSLTVMFSRIFHIGLCGIHTKNTDCDPKLLLPQLNTNFIGPLENVYLKNYNPNIFQSFDSFNSISENYEFINSWHEKPFSQKDELFGVEGWTSGRIYQNNVISEFWVSDINKNECLRES